MTLWWNACVPQPRSPCVSASPGRVTKKAWYLNPPGRANSGSGMAVTPRLGAPPTISASLGLGSNWRKLGSPASAHCIVSELRLASPARSRLRQAEAVRRSRIPRQFAAAKADLTAHDAGEGCRAVASQRDAKAGRDSVCEQSPARQARQRPPDCRSARTRRSLRIANGTSLSAVGSGRMLRSFDLGWLG